MIVNGYSSSGVKPSFFLLQAVFSLICFCDKVPLIFRYDIIPTKIEAKTTHVALSA
jgi:hypothetical protein